MQRPKIVLSSRVWRKEHEVLLDYCEVQRWKGPGPIPRELLLEWLADADGFFSSGNVNIDNELLDAAPNLKVIAQSSVGYNNVDIDACTKRGIPFGNTAGVPVEAVANLVFGLLLTLTRRIHEGWELVKNGEWKEVFGEDLYGKTLGIIGMGDIGSAVAKRAKVSGMNIIYHNRSRREDDMEIGATYVSFDRLLEVADCVVVLAPLSEATRGMFGEAEFAMMKNTAYFINGARGAIVQTGALYEALKNNQIAYAALDVTDPEPLPKDHPLLSLSNIFITPHIGSATYDTRKRMTEVAIGNILAGLERKPLPVCVNQEANY